MPLASSKHGKLVIKYLLGDWHQLERANIPWMTNIVTHHISRDTLHSTGFQLGPIYGFDSFPTDWAGFWSLKNISKQKQITRYIGWMQSWSSLSIFFIWLSVHLITLNIVSFFCMLAINVHFSEIVPRSPPGFIILYYNWFHCLSSPMNVKTPMFHAIFNLSIAYLKQVICVLHLTDLNTAGEHSMARPKWRHVTWQLSELTYSFTVWYNHIFISTLDSLLRINL